MGLGAKIGVTDWTEREGRLQPINLMTKKAASSDLISGFDFIWLPDPGSNQGPIDYEPTATKNLFITRWTRSSQAKLYFESKLRKTTWNPFSVSYLLFIHSMNFLPIRIGSKAKLRTDMNRSETFGCCKGWIWHLLLMIIARFEVVRSPLKPAQLALKVLYNE